MLPVGMPGGAMMDALAGQLLLRAASEVVDPDLRLAVGPPCDRHALPVRGESRVAARVNALERQRLHSTVPGNPGQPWQIQGVSGRRILTTLCNPVDGPPEQG